MCEWLCYLVKCTRMTEDVWVSFYYIHPSVSEAFVRGKRGLPIEGKTGLQGRGTMFLVVSLCYVWIFWHTLSPKQPAPLELIRFAPDVSLCNINSLLLSFTTLTRDGKFVHLNISKPHIRAGGFPFSCPALCLAPDRWGCAVFIPCSRVGSTLVGSSLSAPSPWQPALPCFGKSPYDK